VAINRGPTWCDGSRDNLDGFGGGEEEEEGEGG